MKNAILSLLVTMGLSGAMYAGDTRSGNYYRETGNWYAGGYFSANGEMSHSSNHAKVVGNAALGGRIFGQNIEALALEYRDESRIGTSPTAYSAIRFAGYTIFSRNYAFSWNLSGSKRQTVLSASHFMFIGPVPVTISGGLGAGVSVGLGFGVNSTSVSAYGSFSHWLYGYGQAGVGISWASIGLRITLDLANCSYRPALYASIYGLSGGLRYTFNPIRVLIEVGIYTPWWTWTYPLVDWSAGGIDTWLM